MLTEGMYIADRYEIIGKIGAGGMSDVYKAKDLTLGRFVAIKVLKPEFSEDLNFVTKFRTEAQSAAGLEHPNIVNIYDVGSEKGMHYIVMEYVEGITLKTYIEKKGQLSFKEAVSIAIQVGRGIEAAHSKQQHDQFGCDGFRALFFTGAGAQRICGRQERYLFPRYCDV